MMRGKGDQMSRVSDITGIGENLVKGYQLLYVVSSLSSLRVILPK